MESVIYMGKLSTLEAEMYVHKFYKKYIHKIYVNTVLHSSVIAPQKTTNSKCCYLNAFTVS